MKRQVMTIIFKNSGHGLKKHIVVLASTVKHLKFKIQAQFGLKTPSNNEVNLDINLLTSSCSL